MPSSNDISAPVAIVGAGPVGLALALGLARHGVRSVLLEKKKTPSAHSKAPGIHVRTREVLQQWGVEKQFLEAGLLRKTIQVYDAAKPAARTLFSLDFSELADEAARPGLLILEQSETERLLLEAVRASRRCEVRFGAELIELKQDTGSVRLTVRDGETERSLAARFAVGCDGAGSFVRQALGLPFEGVTYALQPMLADVRIEDRRDALPWPRMHNSPDGLTLSFRLRPGLWRIIHLESGEARKSEEVPDAEVHRHAGKVLGAGPVDVTWASRFRIHRRASPRFRVGRVLLAGDAAHVHSPVGGFGMNGGIQDAHNLAWKLAHALRGGDTGRLFESYEAERRAVVVGNISRYTDVVTRAFLQTPSLVRTAAFALMRLLLGIPGLRHMGLRRSAMLDLGYSHSPLLDADARAAGTRLPNPRLRAPDGSRVRLYELLPSAPLLLHVAEHHPSEPFEQEAPVEHVLRIGPGSYRDPTGLLRDLLGRRDGWILVRPDAHVAWTRDHLEGIEAAMRHALGTPTAG